jgi:hypothetical protein
VDTQITDQRRNLDDLLRLVAEREPDDPVQIHLTHYLCVRICGFLERSVAHIYQDHARRNSHASIASFVAKQLKRIPNPKAEMLCQLVQQFDDEWARDLRDFLGEERKDAIDSVVNNRNNIAHGYTVSFGLHTLRDWYVRIVEVVDFLERQASPAQP